MIEILGQISQQQVSDLTNYFSQHRQYTGHIAMRGQPIRACDENKHELSAYANFVTYSAPHIWELVERTAAKAKEFLQTDYVFVYSINCYWSRPGDIAKCNGIKTEHTDSDDSNFLPVFVYLTDVLAPEDGPLVVEETPIYGKAGTIFCADTKKPHYGMMPTRANRLMFWIRWGVSHPPKAYRFDATRPIQRSRIAREIPDTAEFRAQTDLLIDWRERSNDLENRRWNFSLFNHGTTAREILWDVTTPLVNSMRALGYDAYRDDDQLKFPKPDKYEPFYVFPEFFTKRISRDLLEAVDAGMEFALITTEWFDGADILNGIPNRTREFLLMADHAKFIWSMVDQPEYARCGRPYVYIPLGYDEGTYRRNETPPIYDLCVFGSPSPTREAVKPILEAKKINYRWIPWGTLRAQRDEIIGQSKFVLGFPPHGQSGEVSSSRRAAALHNDRPVFSVDWLDKFHPNDFDWNAEREKQLTEFRKLDMKAYVQNALDQTCN